MQCCFHIDASSQAMNLKIVATHGVKFKLRSRMYMDDELSLCLLAVYRRRFGHLHGPGDILFPAVGKQSGSREVGIAAHASRPSSQMLARQRSCSRSCPRWSATALWLAVFMMLIDWKGVSVMPTLPLTNAIGDMDCSADKGATQARKASG